MSKITRIISLSMTAGMVGLFVAVPSALAEKKSEDKKVEVHVKTTNEGQQVNVKVNGETVVDRNTMNDSKKEEKQEKKEEKKDEKKAEVKAAVTEKKQEVKETILEKLLQLKTVVFASAKVTATTGSSLTVEKDGASYTVTIDDKTRVRWHFWGKGTFADIQVGDKVNVIGKWTDSTKNTVLARLVRDLSIQKRFGVLVGTITSIDGNTWKLQPVGKRDTQTVTIDSTTAFFNRRNETIAQSDIQVGNRVRVKGLWDRQAHTLTDVSNVKDYMLPQRSVTGTPTP